jgi:MFS family permease
MHSNTKDPGVAPLSSPTSGARNINARDHEIHPGEIAVGVIIGRASEYFDFFVYGIASVLVFPMLFFPFADRLEGTLYSFVLFALAFIARPIGTVVFMDIQRRFSREAKLTIALFMMGLSTVVIAFLPGYAKIGNVAIILLAVMRCGMACHRCWPCRRLKASVDGTPCLASWAHRWAS